MLRRLLYPFARKIVFVSQGAADAYNWIRSVKKAVILNAVENVPQELFGKDRRHEIVAVGRLVELKGYDLLIDAFAKISSRHLDWRLVIYGEGPFRPGLEKKIRLLGLKDKVSLPGPTRNVQAVLAEAGMFVLSSRYEGMPNALLEAMSVGAPCVSFDCPFGPNEVITHDQNGLLIPLGDVDRLADAMAYMIENPQERKRLGDNAQFINQRLSLEKITAQWQAVIDECLP
jgi:GalNAc-alpha-(1->4)-GalNAc-alpha-(1->3)-diNAcBac-PP-undecaprenol alpha-1,4-N-acetyl-D-galactosaminyltransferase